MNSNSVPGGGLVAVTLDVARKIPDGEEIGKDCSHANTQTGGEGQGTGKNAREDGGVGGDNAQDDFVGVAPGVDGDVGDGDVGEGATGGDNVSG